MRKFNVLLFLCLLMLPLFTTSGAYANSTGEPILNKTNQDTNDKQVLYKGRIWRSMYNMVEGDQFLFANEFLPGTVTIDSIKYTNLNLKYDIYNDEILTPMDRGIILMLNKEMIGEFTLKFEGRTYLFRNLIPDSVNKLTGFVNVLKQGKTALYVKYKKEIQLLAVENKYDLFLQTFKTYLLKDGTIYPMNSRRELFNLLSDKQQEIKGYIKGNRNKVSRKDPASFIPVLSFYDSLFP